MGSGNDKCRAQLSSKNWVFNTPMPHFISPFIFTAGSLMMIFTSSPYPTFATNITIFASAPHPQHSTPLSSFYPPSIHPLPLSHSPRWKTSFLATRLALFCLSAVCYKPRVQPSKPLPFQFTLSISPLFSVFSFRRHTYLEFSPDAYTNVTHQFPIQGPLAHSVSFAGCMRWNNKLTRALTSDLRAIPDGHSWSNFRNSFLLFPPH